MMEIIKIADRVDDRFITRPSSFSEFEENSGIYAAYTGDGVYQFRYWNHEKLVTEYAFVRKIEEFGGGLFFDDLILAEGKTLKIYGTYEHDGKTHEGYYVVDDRAPKSFTTYEGQVFVVNKTLQEVMEVSRW